MQSTEKQHKTNIAITIKPINYPAQITLGKFNSDSKIVFQRCNELFSREVNLESPAIIALRQAAEQAIADVEADVAALKTFLLEYVNEENKNIKNNTKI